jgi:hypothetical protein
MRKSTSTPSKSETDAATKEPAPPQGVLKSDKDGFAAAFVAARGTISVDLDLEA